MATTTLAQLRPRAQRRADMENSQFVASSEWTDLLNAARRELFDVLVDTDEDYVTSQASYTPTKDSSAAYLTIASTAFKVRGVELRIATGTPSTYESVPRINWAERNVTGTLSYAFAGTSQVNLYPPESVNTADSYRVTYIAFPTDLVNESDALAAYESQWDEYVITRAAIWALEKEESDTGALMRDLDGYKARVIRSATNRDVDQAGRIIDVYPDWQWFIPRLPR